jgi:hypothetical protein
MVNNIGARYSSRLIRDTRVGLGLKHAWKVVYHEWSPQQPVVDCRACFQEKHDNFRKRFPAAEELGDGALCSMTACTSPYLFARDVKQELAQTQLETWGPCLQEVPLDTKMTGVHQPGNTSCQIGAAVYQCVLSPSQLQAQVYV